MNQSNLKKDGLYKGGFIIKSENFNKFIILTSLIIAILATLFIVVFSKIGKDELEYHPVHISSNISIARTESSDSTDIPESQPPQDTYVILKDEWFLKLVNKSTPLPQDFKVEVKAINANGYYFDERALQPLLDMLGESEKAGMKLRVVSGYRTIERQKALYDQKFKEIKATGKSDEETKVMTDMLVAPAGASEHNLGLCIDLAVESNPKADISFEDTQEFKWLMEYGASYGFILRYSKEKEDITSFTYEPWHFRYVGVEDANRIISSGLCLEEYLA